MQNFLWSCVRLASVPVLGSVRYAASLALLCMTWLYDTRAINSLYDMNLLCVTRAASAVDGSGRIEAALRGLSAEKMLLFAEVSILVWIVGRIAWLPFGLVFNRRLEGSNSQQRAVTPRTKPGTAAK